MCQGGCDRQPVVQTRPCLWGRITNWEGEKGGRGDREKGGRGDREITPAPLLDRMMALSVAWQEERPNVEAADMATPVVRRRW
ncbi:MAG TPA: hypothetical protein PK205_18845 [Promineifilum sp.]|nr:hypothetical protein [Promineifilum sp.]